MKKLFIAATGQNAGKTTVALGLIEALRERTPKIGFIKPVGQRYMETPRGKFDEDAILIDQVCKLPCPLEHMSPVTVGRGFTRDYILGKVGHDLVRQILDAFAIIAQDKDIVVIEGTGHAGVGAVIDLSNARVATLLDAPVLIVTEGGIGRPIDEVALNLELFRKEGARVLGVVLNKVAKAKLEMIREVAGKGMARIGTAMLGCIPDVPFLVGPTLWQILAEIGGDVLCGEESLDRHVEKIVIGAMTPHQFLAYLSPNMLVITGGDREDLILATMSSHLATSEPVDHVAGMVLTGGITPHGNILQLIRRTRMPVIAVKEDSYQTASRIHDLNTKIQPSDIEKIQTVRSLVKQHVDVDEICGRL